MKTLPMKRKIIIIAVSKLLLCVLLFSLFSHLYIKKVVIFNLENIEFTGISPDEIMAIKINGITPLNKKCLLSFDNYPCYKAIEIIIPDTLVSKITSVRITTKSNVYKFKICELNSQVLSGNSHAYVLGSEVQKEGALLTKLFTIFKHFLYVSLSFLKTKLIIILKTIYILVTAFLIWYLR